jgi:hypothetical protein
MCVFYRSKKLGDDGTILVVDDDTSAISTSTSATGAAGSSSSGAMRHEVVVHAGHDEEHDDHEGLDEASLREHEEVTKVKVSATASAHNLSFFNLVTVLLLE